MADKIPHGHQTPLHSRVSDKNIMLGFSSPTMQRVERNVESNSASPSDHIKKRQCRKIPPGSKSPCPQRMKKPSSVAMVNFAEKYKRTYTI